MRFCAHWLMIVVHEMSTNLAEQKNGEDHHHDEKRAERRIDST